MDKYPGQRILTTLAMEWARNNFLVWHPGLVCIRLKRLLLVFVLIEKKCRNSRSISSFCDWKTDEDGLV